MDARISSSSGKETKIAIQLRHLDVKERRQRALRALGVCWGIAILSAPLPPIHWVTVPFFFFFGFYLAAKRWREGKHLIPFEFSCPECGQNIAVKGQALQTRWEVVCPHCRFALRAENLEGSSAT